jgi:DNA polymerase elongation subunit (family B)
MDSLLTGHDSTTRIVACHLLNDQQIRLYTRSDKEVQARDVDFFPFFFLSEGKLLDGFERKYWLKELAGANHYKYLAVFSRWNDLWEAIRVSLDRYNKTVPAPVTNYTEGEFLLFRPDPISQYMMQSGVTLFKGMEFSDIRRIQFSFATFASKGRMSDARKTEDRILAVVLTDNSGWEETLDGRKLGEKELLARFMDLIRERDPDVLESHNLFAHDLPYLLQRCMLHELECSIGRDGSEPKLLAIRSGSPDFEREASVYELPGRHLIDTLLQVEYYDFSKRSLESYDLISLSVHFGLPLEKNAFLKPAEMTALWTEKPRMVLDSLRVNADTIRAVSEHLSPSSFHLAQMVPLSYGTIARTGSAVKIETLLLREYLRLKHSVPRPETGSQTTGGYADIFLTGVFKSVVHADVESLYPSIILSRSIQPRSDELGVYRRLLNELVRMRLDAKHRMNECADRAERARLDALQMSFKILINSFYGYLGYARGLFNDYQKADEVTKAGQELLREIVHHIELYNGKVVEVDTDGVYFLPPDNVVGEDQENALVARISQTLPEGINLVKAGRFKKMMSYKKKNYAILDEQDGLIIRGSSLTSRSMEPFLRRFLRLAIANLLDDKIDALHMLYGTLKNDIMNHRWDVSSFSRTENIHDPFFVYEREIGEGKRNPAAVYEVARLAGLIPKPGDRISYYVTGTTTNVKISENCRLAEDWDPNFPDENTAYYLGRLEEAAQKFETFFSPEHFRAVFSSDDLFGFDPKGITIISAKVLPASEQASPPEENRSEFRIWLDET